MGLYKREGSPHWWYKFRIRGQSRPIRESSGTISREEAEQVEARRKHALWEQDRLGIKASKDWGTAVVSYLATLEECRNKEQTKAELRLLGAKLREVPLNRIDLDTLQSLQQHKAAAVSQRTGKPAAPGTVNRAVGMVMAVLHHAAAKKWLEHVPELAQIPDTVKVIRFITRADALRLLAELPDHQSRMVVFALETGLRRSNITQLRWEQVDLKRRIAWVNPDEAKEGKGIAVPLSATAVELLRTVEGDDPDYVFVYRGKPVRQTTTKAWTEAKERAGIKNFRWHDLRHTWASWHRQDGTPTAVLKELGGWKDDRMPGRYAHLGAEHLAEYVNRREGLGTKVGTAVKKQKQKTGCK